jgi:hypothetical protein
LDKQTAIDRITENENLTDNLEDDEASWLIDWGIKKATEQVASIKNDDTAGDKLDAVMAVMRKLNQIVGSRAAKQPNVLAEDVRSLATMYADAFGSARTLAAPNLNDAAKQIKQKSPQETLEYLLNLVEPGSAGSSK